MTHKFVNNWSASIIAGGIFALDFPSIAMSNTLLTETLFTFLVVLSIFCLVLFFKNDQNVQLLIVSAFLMGLAILCRPIAVFLSFFIIILFFFDSMTKKLHILRRSVLIVVLSFLVVSPWIIRNQIIFGSPFISTIGYYNLLYYRAAGVVSVKEGLSRPDAATKLMFKAQSDFKGNIEKDPIGLKKFEAQMGISIIIQNLPIYIQNHAISVFNMLFRPIRSTFDLQLGFNKSGTTITEWGEQYKSSIFSRIFAQTSPLTVLLVIIQLPFLLVLWCGFIYGILFLFEKKKSLPLLIIILLVFYFCIMSGGPEAWARFRVPIVPFLSIGCGIGLSAAYERIKRKFIRRNLT